jgi:hypothetical protein
MTVDTVEQPVVETEAPVVPEAPPVGDAENQTPETSPEPEKKPEDNSVIRTFRKQLRNLQRENAELRKKVAQPEPEPMRENFDSDDDYIKATVDHRVGKAVEKITQQSAPSVNAQKIEAARKAYPDYDEVVENAEVMFDDDQQVAFRKAVETLSYGGDLYYAVSKDPDLIAELEMLPPHSLAARLGEIHADIKASKAKQAPKTEGAKPRGENTRAPAPITPVVPRGTVSVDTSKMTDAEYFAYRAEQRRNKPK